MFAVLVYDIPCSRDGLIRRSKLCKLCKKYGYHVQNSTFEFSVDYSRFTKLKSEILKIINDEEDSVRIYILGKCRTDNNVVLLGCRELIESSDSSFVF